MKQQYVKPTIFFERFGLTQSIANGCGVILDSNTLGDPNHSGRTVCGWVMGGLAVFVEGLEKCTHVQVDRDADYNGVCYNNPEGAQIFGS